MQHPPPPRRTLRSRTTTAPPASTSASTSVTHPTTSSIGKENVPLPNTKKRKAPPPAPQKSRPPPPRLTTSPSRRRAPPRRSREVDHDDNPEAGALPQDADTKDLLPIDPFFPPPLDPAAFQRWSAYTLAALDARRLVVAERHHASGTGQPDASEAMLWWQRATLRLDADLGPTPDLHTSSTAPFHGSTDASHLVQWTRAPPDSAIGCIARMVALYEAACGHGEGAALPAPLARGFGGWRALLRGPHEALMEELRRLCDERREGGEITTNPTNGGVTAPAPIPSTRALRPDGPPLPPPPAAPMVAPPSAAPGVATYVANGTANSEMLYLTSRAWLEDSTMPFVELGARRAWESRSRCVPYIHPTPTPNQNANPGNRPPHVNHLNHNHLKFTPATRQLVVDWAFNRRSAMQLSSETVHLAIRLFDQFLRGRDPERFLARHPPQACCRIVRPPLPRHLTRPATDCPGSGPRAVRLPAQYVPGDAFASQHEPNFPSKLRRLLCTCLLVAAKIHERQSLCPSAALFACADPGFRRIEILAAERVLIKDLGYQVLEPTSVSFSGAFIDRAWARTGRRLHWRHVRMEQRVAAYLLDLAALCHELLALLPSQLAAGAAWLATGMLLPDAHAGLPYKDVEHLSPDPDRVQWYLPSRLFAHVEPGDGDEDGYRVVERDGAGKGGKRKSGRPGEERQDAEARRALVVRSILGYPQEEVEGVARMLAHLCCDALQFPSLAVHSNPHPLNVAKSIVVNAVRRVPQDHDEWLASLSAKDAELEERTKDTRIEVHEPRPPTTKTTAPNPHPASGAMVSTPTPVGSTAAPRSEKEQRTPVATPVRTTSSALVRPTPATLAVGPGGKTVAARTRVQSSRRESTGKGTGPERNLGDRRRSSITVEAHTEPLASPRETVGAPSVSRKRPRDRDTVERVEERVPREVRSSRRSLAAVGPGQIPSVHEREAAPPPSTTRRNSRRVAPR